MNGKPISFLAVFSVTIVLTIFFGAWAVSEDLEDQGLAALARPLATEVVPESDTSEATNSASVGKDGISYEAVDAAWWQDTLLNLCPIH